jgi:dipeptidyl-peptidase-3
MNSTSKSLIQTDIIQRLNFNDSFDQLSSEERYYLYYLSKASWAGQPIVLFQTSYESPGLFMIFQLFFSSFKKFSDIKPTLLKNNVTDVNYNQFIKYAAYFYSNFGNYTPAKNKIIPNLPRQDFEVILKLSDAKEQIMPIWEIISYIIYDNGENVIHINLEEKNGKNIYYFGAYTKEKIQKADEILKKNNYSLLNTRLYMLNQSKTVALFGSIEEKQINLDNENILYYGEYSSFLKRINEYLEKAEKHIVEENEKLIISDYMNFFKTGDINLHREAQKKWVEGNTSTTIDFNMGWNEKFMDPMGVRGLFEGFVGIYDNFYTIRNEEFVKLIPDLIKELPWDSNFEKEISTIQFNSMDIISFARNGCPFGKSLPNYNEIRENNGVKDIIFMNVIPTFDLKDADYFFCEKKAIELINSLGGSASKMMISMKQLIGYRQVKFFRVEKNENNEEKSNFNRELINPLTKQVIDKYYLNNETFDEKFGSNASIINECLATLTVLYFCGNKNVQNLFYINNSDRKDITYIIWTIYFMKGIIGLKNYIEKSQSWVHPSSQSLWIIVNYFLHHQKEEEEIIKIDLDEEKETFKININKLNILISPNEILLDLMPKMHIWRCIGDAESANQFIDQYSKPDEKCLKIKTILDKIELPKTLYLYNNLILDEEGLVKIKEYPNTLEGIIESNLDRFGTEYNKDIYAQWVKYVTQFIKV